MTLLERIRFFPMFLRAYFTGRSIVVNCAVEPDIYVAEGDGALVSGNFFGPFYRGASNRVLWIRKQS